MCPRGPSRCYVHLLGKWTQPHDPDTRSPIPFLSGSKLTHVVLVSPINEKQGFFPVQVNLPPPMQGAAPSSSSSSSLSSSSSVQKKQIVNFLLVIPVTDAEAQWKREVGIERSLYYVLGDTKINPNIPIDYVINQFRPCCVEDLDMPRKIAEREEIECADDYEDEEVEDYEKGEEREKDA